MFQYNVEIYGDNLKKRELLVIWFIVGERASVFLKNRKQIQIIGVYL